MSMASLQTHSDSWDNPTASFSEQRLTRPPSDSVRDDWDEEEDESEGAIDPQNLWEEANRREPMPELVISGSSTSAAGALSPPPAAFQPVLRILKRPTATPSSSSSTSSVPTSNSSSSSDTYAEREARYQAARDRIFGDSSPVSNDPAQQKPPARSPNTSPPPVQVVRDPKGPPTEEPGSASPNGRTQNGDARGFGSRRGKRRGGGKS